mmetsp:Transcript_90185/g.250557  ORF Transcript_90185/g.250557 Transcript_90185/m.250557 type:complete len:489 (-) Transcript_90185:2206-3672(-)
MLLRLVMRVVLLLLLVRCLLTLLLLHPRKSRVSLLVLCLLLLLFRLQPREGLAWLGLPPGARGLVGLLLRGLLRGLLLGQVRPHPLFRSCSGSLHRRILGRLLRSACSSLLGLPPRLCLRDGPVLGHRRRRVDVELCQGLYQLAAQDLELRCRAFSGEVQLLALSLWSLVVPLHELIEHPEILHLRVVQDVLKGHLYVLAVCSLDSLQQPLRLRPSGSDARILRPDPRGRLVVLLVAYITLAIRLALFVAEEVEVQDGAKVLEPLADLALAVVLHRQAGEVDLGVPLAGINDGPLGHWKLIDVQDAALHFILLDRRPGTTAIERAGEGAALCDLAVADLGVVHLLNDLRSRVRAVQAHIGRTLMGLRVLHDADLLRAAEEGEGEADLRLLPTFGEAAHNDGVRWQVGGWRTQRWRLPRRRCLLWGAAPFGRARLSVGLRRRWGRGPRGRLQEAHPEALGLAGRCVVTRCDLLSRPVVHAVKLLCRQLC